MTVLLTGGAGFIGSHVLCRLLREQRPVVVLDALTEHLYASDVKRENLKAARAVGEFPLEIGDIRDTELVERICREHKVTEIIHLAALAGVRSSLEHALEYFDVNVTGTTALLATAGKLGIRRAAVASSSSVYGRRATPPFREDAKVDASANPYAASKAAMELAIESLCEVYSMSVNCLRYFTVYGPRQRPDMAANTFLRHAHQGRAIPMFGDGSSSRDYTFVADAVEGTLRSLAAAEGFGVYNIGGGHVVKLSDFVAELGRASGLPIAIDHLPVQATDMPTTVSDCGAAKADFGYRPATDLREGLAQMSAWYAESQGRMS